MDMEAAIANQVDFSLHLSHHVASKLAPSSNLVLSPLSLHVVLALLAAGSKGQTLDQLTSFLRSGTAADLSSLASQLASLVLTDASPSGGPVLAFPNAVWVDSSLSLKPSFRDVATSAFRAHAASLDFQNKPDEAANNVNSWAEKETQGLIKELLPSGSVDSATRLILSNALYFKGAWTQKFDTAKTEDLDFHLLDGSSVKVPFMTSSDKQFVSSFLDFKVLGMPYKHGTDRRQFSMYIFLPDAKDGLWSLAEKLGSGSQFLGRHIPMEKVSISEFRIPKFKISYGFEASSPLKDLGLTLPFGGEGDLTEMVDSTLGHTLFVSSIFHKSFVEVNEEGTEAAAASAAVIKFRSVRPSEPVSFVADHPFIFFIREDVTGVVLFIGHVLDPRLTA